jgi:hypothetical protein
MNFSNLVPRILNDIGMGAISCLFLTFINAGYPRITFNNFGWNYKPNRISPENSFAWKDVRFYARYERTLLVSIGDRIIGLHNPPSFDNFVEHARTKDVPELFSTLLSQEDESALNDILYQGPFWGEARDWLINKLGINKRTAKCLVIFQRRKTGLYPYL